MVPHAVVRTVSTQLKGIVAESVVLRPLLCSSQLLLSVSETALEDSIPPLPTSPQNHRKPQPFLPAGQGAKVSTLPHPS